MDEELAEVLADTYGLTTPDMVWMFTEIHGIVSVALAQEADGVAVDVEEMVARHVHETVSRLTGADIPVDKTGPEIA
ncbi:hypothetical protein Cme02nite_37960 [Catellatospora methionotrophica]|uniref:Uncharacterized protein n=1 Tax=Catellatospora methionotrophica TaxID=121620 RepID=A0A8J3LBS8_9ACTN|nr:hypothetical protein [Catellatospora methionotrophica]GIG15464.1 hypothetical protein Cme02nite_37960 [Catellatospora methionotrophica]